MNTKNCGKCKEVKALTEFYKSKTLPQGVSRICKSCDKVRRDIYISKRREVGVIKDWSELEPKACSKCKEVKPSRSFSRSKTSICGLVSTCISCCNISQTSRKKENTENLKNKTTGLDVNKCCSKCEELKPISEFSKTNTNSSGYTAECIVCRRLRYVKNREKKLLEPVPSVTYKICSTCKVEKTSDEFTKHKLSNTRLSGECKSCKKITTRKCSPQKNKRRKTRYISDPIYRLESLCRSRIGQALRRLGQKKTVRTSDMIGCSWDELYGCLMSTFLYNYGRLPGEKEEIHIDHIVPISSATTEEDVLKLNHYSNLQYLTASDNLEKSDNLNWKKG